MAVTIITFGTEIVGQVLGHLEAECPHCKTTQQLARRKLVGKLMGVISFPQGEVLTCAGCGKFSRKEGMASRVFGVVFMAPMALLLAAGMVAGLYFLGSMLFGEFSLGFFVVGIILVAVAGYIDFLVLRAMKRMLSPWQLLALGEGLQTKL